MYPAYEVSHYLEPRAENYTPEHARGVAAFVVQDFPASQRLHTVFPAAFW
jgi:hypothetical protein